MEVKFFIHDSSDSVGVAVENVTAGETVKGWGMEDDSYVEIKVNEDIPLGHKIALKKIEEGEKVIKYGRPIGVATKSTEKGYHVHTQNLKSVRW